MKRDELVKICRETSDAALGIIDDALERNGGGSQMLFATVAAIVLDVIVRISAPNKEAELLLKLSSLVLESVPLARAELEALQS